MVNLAGAGAGEIGKARVQRQSQGLEFDCGLVFLGNPMIAQQRIQFGQDRVSLGFGQDSIVAGFSHQVGQVVGGPKEQFDRVAIGHQRVAAHCVQYGFVTMGKAHQPLKSEGASAALDRVDSPKDHVDRFKITAIVGHRFETVLQGFEQFFAFDEKRGSDFSHRVGCGHDAFS